MNRPPFMARLLLGLWAGAALIFLLVPVLIVIPMSFSSARALVFPPPGLSLRWFESLFTDPGWMEAFSTSALIAMSSASLAVLLGGLTVYGLDRGRQRWRTLVETNLMAPLIVPGVITAIALYFFFAKYALLGTYAGVVIAHTVLAVPFVVMVLNTAIRSFDFRLEQVAWSLGANWRQTVTRVLLPNLGPSIAAAWIFAFVISFDEVIVTSFIAGPINTVPKKMYNELLMEITPTITAVATLLIVFTVLVMFAAYKLNERAKR